MKIFAIRNENRSDEKDLAILLYYEKDKKFFIELPEDSFHWEVPLILSSFVKRGIYSIDAEWSKKWVQQRIVPPERQNIGQILRDNKLKGYDEYNLLLLSMGRCEQDDYYLVQLKEIPAFIKIRYENKVEAVTPLDDHQLLVFFCNGDAKKYNAKAMYDRLYAYYQRLNPEILFYQVKVETGGYGVCWGNEVRLSKDELYMHGERFPFTLKEMKAFVQHSTVNSAEAAEILNCSRQNIDDLVKRGKLNPLKKSEKSMLFLKDEVLERLWD